MTNSDILSDIGFLKTVAEEGRNAPLLGGRIGLMWTVLLIPALAAHGAAAQGILPIEPKFIGAIWMAFGIIGTLLAFIMARSIDKNAGTQSFANRLENIIWPLNAGLIFTYAITIAIGAGINDVPHIAFNTIMPLAFALGTLNLGLLGAVTKKGYLKFGAFCSAAGMIACTLFLKDPVVYFIAAFGVIFSGVIPSLMQMKDESVHG